MKKDRIKWNDKHAKDIDKQKPADIVTEFWGLAKEGRALDIACGTGNNALFLAERGFVVDALDISEVGLKKAGEKHPRIRPACVDLDHYDIAPNRYDLILNIRFLKRRLFPYIKEGLVEGGVLIFESFMEGPGGDGGESADWRPSCRDYLFRENELLHSFLSMKIRYYREGESREPKTPPLMASLVAVR